MTEERADASTRTHTELMLAVNALLDTVSMNDDGHYPTNLEYRVAKLNAFARIREAAEAEARSEKEALQRQLETAQRQLDVVDEVLAWKGTGRGRVESVESLQQELAEVQQTVDSLRSSGEAWLKAILEREEAEQVYVDTPMKRDALMQARLAVDAARRVEAEAESAHVAALRAVVPPLNDEVRPGGRTEVQGG